MNQIRELINESCYDILFEKNHPNETKDVTYKLNSKCYAPFLFAVAETVRRIMYEEESEEDNFYYFKFSINMIIDYY